MAVAVFFVFLFPIGEDDISEARVQPGTVSLLIIADGNIYSRDSRAATVGDAFTEAGVRFGPHDAILLDNVRISPATPLQTSSPSTLGQQITLAWRPSRDSSTIVLRLQRAAPITIHEDGFVASINSSETTVGDALGAAGVQLGPFDLVTPSLTTPLSAGLHLYVSHALPVELIVAGEARTVYTHATTVGQLLREQEIAVDEDDLLSPAADAPIHRGLEVKVTLMRIEEVVEEEYLAAAVVYWDDNSLPIGTNRVLEPGSDGALRRVYRLTYIDGEIASRELVSEEHSPPSNKVIIRGIMPIPHYLLLPDGSVITYEQTLRVQASWYNAISADGDGITATGAPLEKGIVAVDPSVIPLGTRLYIPGYGYGLAADTGGSILGYMLDLGYPGSTIGGCCTGWMTIYVLP